jgi:hypothetical protein
VTGCCGIWPQLLETITGSLSVFIHRAIKYGIILDIRICEVGIERFRNVVWPVAYHPASRPVDSEEKNTQ